MKGKQEPKKEQIREPLLSAPPVKKTQPGKAFNIYELSDAEKQLIKYRLNNMK